MVEGFLGGVLGGEDEKPEIARKTAAFLDHQSRLLETQREHLKDEHALRLAHLRDQLGEENIRRFGLRLRVGFQLFLVLVATVSKMNRQPGQCARQRCARWVALPLAGTLIAGVAAAQDFLNEGPGVVVQTTYGPVAGVQNERVQVFRGIPYAAPPIGDRQFRQAVPPIKWVHPRPARMRTPACPQVLNLDDPAEDGDSIMSEDCLTLNVWTPRSDSKARPVMVFIHGGALVEGSAADSWYDGTVMANTGEAS